MVWYFSNPCYDNDQSYVTLNICQDNKFLREFKENGNKFIHSSVSNFEVGNINGKLGTRKQY